MQFINLYHSKFPLSYLYQILEYHYQSLNDTLLFPIKIYLFFQYIILNYKLFQEPCTLC